MSNVHVWRTEVTYVDEDDIFIRGTDIRELIRNRSFTEVIFLTLKGRFPEKREQRMLDAALASLVDHGFVSSHVTAARFIVSGNPSIVAGVAGGVLAAGPNTLSPETAAKFLDDAMRRHKQLGGSVEQSAEAIVAGVIERAEKIPGFGHVTHKKEDPRTPALRAVAEELGWIGERTRLYEAIHRRFTTTKKRHLPINADGMLAALLGEMGWSAGEMAGLAVLAALPGLLAHVVEEIDGGVPHRFIPSEQVSYVGAPPNKSKSAAQ
jgi:citryl-CoA lyase